MKRRITLLLICILCSLSLLNGSIKYVKADDANTITKISSGAGGLTLTNKSMTLEGAKAIIKTNVANGKIDNLTIKDNNVVSTKSKYSEKIIYSPIFIYAEESNKYKAIIFDVEENKYIENINYSFDDIYTAMNYSCFYVLGSTKGINTGITKVTKNVDTITLSNEYVSDTKAKEIAQNAVVATTMKTTDLLIYRYLGANVNSGQDQYKYLKYSGGNWVAETFTVTGGSTLVYDIRKKSDTYFVVGTITEKDYLSAVQEIDLGSVTCDRTTGNLTIKKFGLLYDSVKEAEENSYDLVCGYAITTSSIAIGMDTRHSGASYFAWVQSVTQITENQITINRGDITQYSNKLRLYVYSNHTTTCYPPGTTIPNCYPVYGTREIKAPEVCVFDLNGGNVGGSTSNLSLYMVQGESLDKETLGISSNPSKDGYEFIGWYTAASDGEKVTKVTSNTTYYAHYGKVITDDMLNYVAPTTLTYDGNQKTATVSLKQAIGGVSINVKYYYDEACTSPLYSAPIDTGTYYVAVDITDSNNEYIPYTARKVGSFAITKATPSKPNLSTDNNVVNETVSKKADGKITGLDSNMQYEYKNAKDSNYTSVTKGSTEITGLLGGEYYYVRYAECANYNASEFVILTVQAGPKITVKFNCNLADHSFNPAIADQTHDFSDKVTKPTDPKLQGYIFKGWYTFSRCYDEDLVDFDNDKLEGSGTTYVLYAKWVEKETLAASDFTFTPPSELVYDGSSKEVSFTEPEGIGTTTIKYYDGETLLTSKPVNAGTYTVKLSATEGDNYLATTDDLSSDSWTFTITKADLTAADFTFTPPTELTFDGNNKVADVTTSETGVGDITVKYFLDTLEVTDTSNVNTYKVKIDVAEGSNYNATTNALTDNDWEFAITRKEVTVTTDDITIQYNETIPDFTATVVGLVGDDTVVYNLDKATAGVAPNDYTITASGEENQGNYHITFANGTLKITKNNKQIVITAGSKSKTYDNSQLTCSEYTYTKDNLGTNETISAITDGSITNVGVAQNKIYSHTILNSDSEDITSYYTNVVYEPGTLTIRSNEKDNKLVNFDTETIAELLKYLSSKSPDIQKVMMEFDLDNLASNDVNLIKSKAKGSKIIPFNVELGYSTGGEHYEAIHDVYKLTDKTKIVCFEVNFDINGKKDVQVFRVHYEDIEEQVDPLQELKISPNEDGEHIEIDRVNKKIKVYASKYSLYAVTYSEVPASSSSSYKVVKTDTK